jgi:hypothetical protein
MADLMKLTLVTIMNHHPYSPDFALSDFHSFGSMSWLLSQDKTFYAVGIINLARAMEKVCWCKGTISWKRSESLVILASVFFL